MSTETQKKSGEAKELTPELILKAFAKLFGEDERGVRRFVHSGLRYVKLPGDAVLVEQNPKKQSEWAELANSGHKVAWAMQNGAYLARVLDGEVEMLPR